jgi:phasin family protein
MYSQFITAAPSHAIGTHCELQLSFLTDIANKMLGASEQIMQLNLQLTLDIIRQMSSANHQLMQAQNPAEFAAAAANQVHPIVEHWRRYQQSLPNVLASTQVDLSKATESHIPKATRSVIAIAEECSCAASPSHAR